MRAVRVIPKEDEALAPFLDPAGGLPLLDAPLAERQSETLISCGFTVDEVKEGDPLPAGTRLAFAASACFSRQAVQALVSRPGPARMGIKAGTALFDFTQPCSGHPADRDLPLPILAGELAGRPAGDWDAPLQTVCDEEEFVAIRVDPYGEPPHVLRVPAGERIAGEFAHWLHVLNLNQAFLERERRSRGAIGRRNAKLGKATVHRTALVEGSILGDGVEVENDASVIDCYLGPGVKIGDHACFHRCVIGAGCHTLIDTHMRRVVAFAGSTLSNLGIEDVVLGKSVFVTTGVAFFANTPGKNARVDGEEIPRPVLGGAVGDRAVLGARSLFGASLAVPAGTTIVMMPGEGITRVDEEGLARAHCRFADPTEDY
jgi:carbonic anhydrase/acetyltransferase-like protein (isoleucine patch superfamily)